MKRIACLISGLFLCSVLCLCVSASSQFILSSESAYPGETVTVEIALSCSEEVNSIALSGFTYDTNALEFIGFSDYDTALADKMLFEMQPDSDKMALTIPLKKAESFNGVLCTMTFKVKESAKGSYTVSATPLTKLKSTVVDSSVVPAEITVKEKMQNVVLSDITLKNSAYEAISAIPTGDFIAEVSLTNNAYNGVCNILLAAYDRDGRMLCVRYLYATPAIGQTVSFGTEFSNADGKIAKIKAFALSDLRTFSVLCLTVEWKDNR